jgi:hypothetical protein
LRLAITYPFCKPKKRYKTLQNATKDNKTLQNTTRRYKTLQNATFSDNMPLAMVTKKAANGRF